MQTIPRIDLYRELEVDPAATAETIDAAWKSLLKRHHPDVTADSTDALERVKRLNLAHEWLGDPAKRAMYDRARRRADVVMVGRAPASPAERNRRRPTTIPPIDFGGGSPSWATVPERGNPYARSGVAPRRMGQQASADESTHPGGRPTIRLPVRLPALLIPVGLASLLMVVAISSFITSLRPSSTNSNVLGASSGPGESTTIAALEGSGAIGPGSSPIDLRGLAPPDLARDVPDDCTDPNLARPFSFEALVGPVPAKVYVVRCAGDKSIGPLVYVAGGEGWQLESRGNLRDGYAFDGFSGPVSGRSPDEFGIAWTQGDGSRATVSLYRIGSGVQRFWDSSSIGLAWTLARFTYQGAPDPLAPGFLIVISADLASGTAGCTTCKDHQLYREFYRWETVAATPGLVRTARQPYGFGPP